MPLSDDPEKRARQLANLRPGAGAWPPGQATNVKSGLRTRNPGWMILSEAAGEIVAALAAGAPVRDEAGEVPVHDRPAIEAAALQLIIVRRVLGYLSTHGFEDARGRLRPEVEGLERANERFLKALDRLGMTPSSRAKLGLDLARTADLATAMSEPDPERRARLMRDAGVVDVDGEEAGDA